MGDPTLASNFLDVHESEPMKSSIAFALAAFALALSACAAESSDPVELTDSAALAEATAIETSALGEPGTATEYTYYRCSLNGGLYLTRPACVEACPGGTCRLTLICKNSSGQQIPCP